LAFCHQKQNALGWAEAHPHFMTVGNSSLEARHMKLPDAVIDKLKDGESPVTHAAIMEGVDMIIRYTCDGKVIGQTMFH
jgi:hypothetical protein